MSSGSRTPWTARAAGARTGLAGPQPVPAGWFLSLTFCNGGPSASFVTSVSERTGEAAGTDPRFTRSTGKCVGNEDVAAGGDIGRLEGFRAVLKQNPTWLGLEAKAVGEGTVGRSTVHIGPASWQASRSTG